MPRHILCYRCEKPLQACQLGPELECDCVLDLCKCPHQKINLESEPDETSTPMKNPRLENQESSESSDSMPERPSSPTLSAQLRQENSYPTFRWHLESQLVSRNKSVTKMAHSISTRTSLSAKNLTSPLLRALTSLQQDRTMIMENKDLEIKDDFTQTSSESEALRTLCALMNTCAKMEFLLLSLQERSISTSFLRTFAMSSETVLAGLIIAVDCLKAHQAGQSPDQAVNSLLTLKKQGKSETYGSGDLLTQARPSGLKRKSTASKTTKSATTDIPSISTAINKSSSTTISCPRRNTFSSSEILQSSPVLCQEIQGTTKGSSRRDSPSGQSSPVI